MKVSIGLCVLIVFAAQMLGATTISPVNKFAYGSNIGWIDWRGDTNNGAIIGEYVCSGFIYSANVGWINLGNGAPTNGIFYQNNSANDFGVNQDGAGNLRGYAYGANIGWINFESTGAPKVDMSSGKMNGYVWSANCGWISLSNAMAHVKTDSIQPGADLNQNGIADAWEYQNFGTTNLNAHADPDGDGASTLNEYLADTNPNDGGDVFRITYIARGDVMPDFTTLRWTSKPTRFYMIQARPALDSSAEWMDSVGYGFGASSATFNTGTTNQLEFYRIRAFRPL